MPKAELPTTMKGWMVALASSAVGFIAGFISLNIFTKWAQ